VSDDDRFIEGFSRAGYEIHFLRPQPRHPQDDARVRTHYYPNFFAATRSLPTCLRRPLWPFLFQLIVVPRTLRLARELHPGVVIGHSHYSTAATHQCRAKLGIPSAVKLFGVMDLVHTEWPAAKYVFKNLEQLSALRYAQDAWIVLDDGTRGGEILRGRGLPADRIHFLPNGLDLEWADAHVDRAAARESFQLPSNAPVVLFLSRLVRSKRPLDFVHAAARVVAGADTGAVFVFAGDGPMRDACQRAAAGAGLAGRFRFLGTVPHHDIPRLMAASDLFVSTSELTNRALPTCEAMLCGVPVVVYDAGDTRTVVRDGETGVVVTDGDVVALADSIARLLGNQAERRRLADNARSLARKTFTSWDQRIGMEMEIIEGLEGRGKE
ncbi:MAG TPA: glycosyltransferase family 4 protein, partial [Candidatus Krumholzibacteria bacterium]|nr:glycosyltransferase family 4 protein [Candidatus Krumholzibacteria bacterium]